MDYSHGNIDTLTNEVEQLLDLDMAVSVDRLLTIAISALQQHGQQNNVHKDQYAQIFMKLFEMVADNAFKRGEYKRAMHYFRLSKQQKLSSQPFKSKNQTIVSCTHGARLKYKECCCLVKLGQQSDAIHELEAVPAAFRTVKINLLLGETYKTTNQKKSAITSYMHVLAAVPKSTEVIEVLAQLGARASEIQRVITNSTQFLGKIEKDKCWLHDLVSGMCAKYSCQYDQSLTHFQRLNIRFPRVPFILTCLASISLNIEEVEGSYYYFRQVRKIDPFLVEDMDVMGKVLSTRGSQSELNKLASDVLDVDPRSWRGWLLAAMYCDIKGDSLKANAFLDKAVQLEPKSAQTFRIKGNIHSKQGSLQVALIAFSQANSLEKDLFSFSGIVHANIGLDKLKDAILAAKECAHLFPLCSAAHLLLGQTLSKAAQPSALGESIRCFQKAHQLSPQNKSATISLVRALSRQERHAEAIDSLNLSLQNICDHELRYLLGKSYADVGNYTDAIQNLHLSISLKSGDNFEATQELSRVEQLIKNENIDAVSDGSYNGGTAETRNDWSCEKEHLSHFLSDDRSES